MLQIQAIGAHAVPRAAKLNEASQGRILTLLNRLCMRLDTISERRGFCSL
jgi:hypothetical protein